MNDSAIGSNVAEGEAEKPFDQEKEYSCKTAPTVAQRQEEWQNPDGATSYYFATDGDFDGTQWQDSGSQWQPEGFADDLDTDLPLDASAAPLHNDLSGKRNRLSYQEFATEATADTEKRANSDSDFKAMKTAKKKGARAK